MTVRITRMLLTSITVLALTATSMALAGQANRAAVSGAIPAHALDYGVVVHDQFVGGRQDKPYWREVFTPLAIHKRAAAAGLLQYTYQPRTAELAGSGLGKAYVTLSDGTRFQFVRNIQTEHIRSETDHSIYTEAVNAFLDQLRAANVDTTRLTLPVFGNALKMRGTKNPALDFSFKRVESAGRHYYIFRYTTNAFMFKAPTGDTIWMTYTGFAVTDPSMTMPYYVGSRYFGQVATHNGGLYLFHGQRLVLGTDVSGDHPLLPPDQLPVLKKLLSRYNDITPDVSRQPINDQAVPPSWAESVQAVAWKLDSLAGVTVEERSNFIALTAIAVGMTVDSVVTLGVNAYGWATNNQAAQGYDGVIIGGAGKLFRAGAEVSNATLGTDFNPDHAETAGKVVAGTASFIGSVGGKVARVVNIVKDGVKDSTSARIITTTAKAIVQGQKNRFPALDEYHALSNTYDTLDYAATAYDRVSYPYNLQNGLQSLSFDESENPAAGHSNIYNHPDLDGMAIAYKNRQSQAIRSALANLIITPAQITPLLQLPLTGSTGGFTDVSLYLPLVFRLYDSGNLEDGDRVQLQVRSASGTNLGPQTVNLTFAGQTFTPVVHAGAVEVSIKALNEGYSPPNTGGISILSDIIAGSSGQHYNLSSGETGVLRIIAK